MEEWGQGSVWLTQIVSLLLGTALILLFGLSVGELAAAQNQEVVLLAFSEEELPESMPQELKRHVLWMREQLRRLEELYETEEETEDKPDLLRLQAYFYALYFGTETDGAPVNLEDYYLCFCARDMEEVYEQLAVFLNREVSEEETANANEIYYLLQYGAPAPTYGAEFDSWVSGLAPEDAETAGSMSGRMISPIGAGWRNVVSSEFGLRRDPISGETKGHGGIDLAVATGTEVRCVLSGTVQTVRYSRSGYGYHVIVNHGGGVVTLYGHCSKLLVREGETVRAGEVIALSGSTGKSTGPHLHFEVRVNGTQQNPRRYLP